MMRNLSQWCFIRQLLAAVICLMLLTGIAQAETFQVTSTADDGAGSLRLAIEDANAAAGPVTIDFSPIAGSTIALEANLPVIVNDLALQGSNVVLDGAGQFTCLAAESADLSVDAMTITQCAGQLVSSSSDDGIHYLEHSGGGIRVELGDLTLNNTSIVNNAAPESTATKQFTLTGGGISVSQAGNVSIINSVIQDNTADKGAGGLDVMSINGDIALTNVVITNNESGEGDGGLFAEAEGDEGASGSITITDSLISNNQANGASDSSLAGGGTLYSRYDVIEIANTIVSDNIGQGWSFGGLVVSAYLGSSIEHSEFSGNEAEDGGGGLLSLGGLNLSDSMITDNSGAGSGLMHFDFSYGSTTASLEMHNTILSGNSASGSEEGGALSGLGGGALVYNFDGEVILESSTISGNSAEYGGGLAVTGSAFDFSLAGSTINANDSDQMGGGLLVQGEEFPFSYYYSTTKPYSRIALSNSTISGNSAASGAGVVIDLEDDTSEGDGTAQVEFDGVTITANNAIDGAGGGLLVTLENPSLVSLKASIISGNNSTEGGADLGAAGDPANTTFEVDVSLIGEAPEDGSVFVPGTVTSDLLGTDPQLDVLADNGGLTQTHLPGLDSPAVGIVTADDGCGASFVIDQRGQNRPGPDNGQCDAGSVERQGESVIAATPSIDFGNTPVGDAAPAADASLANVGGEKLEVNGLIGPDAPFTLDFSDCSDGFPFILMPGEDCNLIFGFLPTASGDFEQDVTVQSNADSGDNAIMLSGKGTVPNLSLGNLDFGDQPVGSATESSITLTNDGEADLIISDLALSGDAVFELIGDDCADPVAPGSSCQADIRFTPDDAGNFAATLLVTSNATETPAVVDITGLGIAGELILAPSGGLDFGNVPVGESGEGEITLGNDGDASIEISAWNDLEAPFAVTGGDCPQPPFNLDPGESCTLYIAFSPTDEGEFEQTLEFAMDDGSGSTILAFSVSGDGTPAPIEPVPVPMFNRIGLIVGSSLLALLGLFRLRRRRIDRMADTW